jgi:hypothetical protein
MNAESRRDGFPRACRIDGKRRWFPSEVFAWRQREIRQRKTADLVSPIVEPERELFEPPTIKLADLMDDSGAWGCRRWLGSALHSLCDADDLASLADHLTIALQLAFSAGCPASLSDDEADRMAEAIEQFSQFWCARRFSADRPRWWAETSRPMEAAPEFVVPVAPLPHRLKI